MTRIGPVAAIWMLAAPALAAEPATELARGVFAGGAACFAAQMPPGGETIDDDRRLRSLHVWLRPAWQRGTDQCRGSLCGGVLAEVEDTAEAPPAATFHGRTACGPALTETCFGDAGPCIPAERVLTCDTIGDAGSFAVVVDGPGQLRVGHRRDMEQALSLRHGRRGSDGARETRLALGGPSALRALVRTDPAACAKAAEAAR